MVPSGGSSLVTEVLVRIIHLILIIILMYDHRLHVNVQQEGASQCAGKFILYLWCIELDTSGSLRAKISVYTCHVAPILLQNTYVSIEH